MKLSKNDLAVLTEANIFKARQVLLDQIIVFVKPGELRSSHLSSPSGLSSSSKTHNQSSDSASELSEEEQPLEVNMFCVCVCVCMYVCVCVSAYAHVPIPLPFIASGCSFLLYLPLL